MGVLYVLYFLGGDGRVEGLVLFFGEREEGFGVEVEYAGGLGVGLFGVYRVFEVRGGGVEGVAYAVF